MDLLTLSRLQFGLTVGFHFLFPPISIGLAWLLVWLEWKGRNNTDYARAGRFFGKLLGLTFAVGVATGIVMEFQFGTNWSRYSMFVGDIFGAPLAAEALFAFFLESTFLGLYLFGRERVSKMVHWFSILMVAIGATISAFWILVANSWQQTPAGYTINNGRAELLSFTEAVFNPSTLPRFCHVFMACILTGAFLMAGISAWGLLRSRAVAVYRKTLKASLLTGFVGIIIAIAGTGHWHAVNVARYQPEKLAAMEGLIEGQKGAPMTLFGLPREEPPGMDCHIAIPGMLSWLATGDSDAFIPGIKDLRAKGRPTPPIGVTFWSFRIMVGLSMLFLLAGAVGVWLLRGGRIWRTRWYLRALVWLAPLPLLTCQVGWLVTEIGRQPWVVYGVMKTADAFSPNLARGEVIFSIVMFSTIYLLLGSLYIYLVCKMIRRGPMDTTAKEA